MQVQQYGEDLLIHADVSPKEAVRFFVPRHLRFIMSDAEGKVLWDLDVARYTNDHKMHGVTKMKHASFWVRMPLLPPAGSVLKVFHHEEH